MLMYLWRMYFYLVPKISPWYLYKELSCFLFFCLSLFLVFLQNFIITLYSFFFEITVVCSFLYLFTVFWINLVSKVFKVVLYLHLCTTPIIVLSGEYFVVGVDIEQYDEENPGKYLKGLLRDETDPVAQSAFRSYLGVVPSSPVGFENFTTLVNTYMERPPFNFPNPLTYLGGGKRVRLPKLSLGCLHLKKDF